MKLDVPFYKSRKNSECAQRALQMVLDYFSEKHSIAELSKLTRQLDSGMTWSLGIVLAAKKRGFNVNLISMTNFNHPEKDIDYYKKYADNKAMLILKKLQKEIKDLKIKTCEKNLSLKELLNYVTENSIPIVLINWFVISGKEGYNGHFVPVVGYDKENIYIHNSGLEKAMPYFPLKKDKFLKAWESKGTDKDTIIIHKNKL